MLYFPQHQLRLLLQKSTRNNSLSRLVIPSANRSFTHTPTIMGVTKTITQEGDGPIPKVGDRVTIEYTGYLKDTSQPDHKGQK